VLEEGQQRRVRLAKKANSRRVPALCSYLRAAAAWREERHLGVCGGVGSLVLLVLELVSLLLLVLEEELLSSEEDESVLDAGAFCLIV